MRKLKNSELDRKTIDEFKKAVKNPLIVILDNIRSLNNVGSVFRTADAFLIEKIYLCGITAEPPHKDIHKTALGATDSVDWEYQKEIVSLIKKLQQKGTKVFAIEQTHGALSLENFEVNKDVKYAIVLGNEVKGISQEVVSQCDSAIEIPQEGTKHSLNIAVASGIVLWDFYHKLKKL